MRYRQKLEVPFEYDVVFTRDLFGERNETLTETLAVRSQADTDIHTQTSSPTQPDAGPARVAVFVDAGVLQHWPDLIEKITAWTEARSEQVFLCAPPMTVPGGEEVKNDLLFVQRMTHQFQRLELCRHSYVMAIGGGAVLDAVGLAAAVFHRGLRLIRVPTTVLSQDDSGMGVKNGVNLDGVKNLIGTFAPPYAVINDSIFLTSLEDRDWYGGLSEAFKVALIKDASLLDELEALASPLANRDLEAMERMVQRCALIHLQHIRTGGDPFELGSARPLDFGHWSAHKLETMTKHELRHGEAVAIGIALDVYCAERMGFISRLERDRACGIMEACGLKLWHSALARRSSVNGTLQVMAGLEEFRQHLGGRLTLTMPNPTGKKIDIHALPTEFVEAGVQWLSQRNEKAQLEAQASSPQIGARASCPQGTDNNSR